MSFERLLLQAKEGNADAVLEILEIYKPLLIKNAIVNGRFDEDLYQELVSTLLQCIHSIPNIGIEWISPAGNCRADNILKP